MTVRIIIILIATASKYKDKLFGPNWKNSSANKNNSTVGNRNNQTSIENTNVTGYNSAANTNGSTNNSSYENNRDIIEKVDVLPRFAGGSNAWVNYLTRNLKADIPAVNGAPPGTYTAVVVFIVDKDGSISNVNCANDPGYGTCAEAICIIKQGPNWVPAKLNGQNVATRYKQSITFRISAE